MIRALLVVLAVSLTTGSWAQIIVTNEKELGGAGLNLRQAVADASSGDTILFSGDLSEKSLEIAFGEIYIDKDLVTEGLGATSLISIEGNGSSRLIRVAEGAELTLRYLKLSGGREFSDYGGGIINDGTVNLEDCEIHQCEATSGGGISNAGELNCSGILFKNNEAKNLSNLQLGGGALLNTGTSTLSGCRFENNAVTGVIFGGGAIHSRKAELLVFE